MPNSPQPLEIVKNQRHVDTPNAVDEKVNFRSWSGG
jgi:hypothetical protein